MPDDAIGRYYEVPERKAPLLPNGVMGMLLFIATEVMFFAGLMSAFVIGKSNAVGGWPPPGQPRLPIEMTGVNTLFLLASAVLLYYANKSYREQGPNTLRLLGWALGLGTTFVLIQGSEWIALIAQGLTITSGQLGGFFYLIVGAHALHVVAALGVLGWTYRQLKAGTLRDVAFWPAQIFWYFVVGVWPMLYWLVYL